MNPLRLFEIVMDAYVIIFFVTTSVSFVLLYISAKNGWRRWISRSIFLVLAFAILPIPFALEDGAVLMPWAAYAVNSRILAMVMLPAPILYFFLLRYLYNRLEKAFKVNHGNQAK